METIDLAKVLVVVKVGQPCDMNAHKPTTKWMDFQEKVKSVLSSPQAQGVDIQALAENVWLIPLQNGLPIARGILAAANQSWMKGLALLAARQMVPLQV